MHQTNTFQSSCCVPRPAIKNKHPFRNKDHPQNTIMIRFLLHIINHELNSRVFSSMHKFRLTTQICTIILPGICTEEGGGTNYMESLSISSLIYVQKMEKSVLFFTEKIYPAFLQNHLFFYVKMLSSLDATRFTIWFYYNGV